MATLPVDGLELAYDEAGSGEPLLLLHEGIADRRMWDDVLPALSESFRVVRCDLRGYGETPLPDGPFAHAADALALLEALGIGRAHVIGASLGGHVALDIAIARPDRVGRLVLVGAGVDGWSRDDGLVAAWRDEAAAFDRGDLDEAAWISVRTWVDGPTRDADAVDATVRRRVFEMQRLAYELENPGAESRWLTPSRRERLGDVRTPTLVLVGARDQPGLRSIARVLADEIPGARFDELPEVAHVPPMEDPAGFVARVLPFLSEGSASR